MIRALHVFLFPVVFILLCDIGRQAGVIKFIKNAQFLVLLAVWVLFPKFLGRVRSGLY